MCLQLCPLGSKLTEACFQATPLEFAHPEKHILRFANASLDREINATLVTEGAGIGWMRNPKPAKFGGCDYVIGSWTKPHFHCNFGCKGCGPPNYPDDAACPIPSHNLTCPSVYPGTPPNVANVPAIFPDHTPGDVHAFSIEDQVKVPSTIPVGDYVSTFATALQFWLDPGKTLQKPCLLPPPSPTITLTLR